MRTFDAGSRLRPPRGATSTPASLARPPAWARRVGRSSHAAKSQLRRPAASTRSSTTAPSSRTRRATTRLRQQRPERHLDLQLPRGQNRRATHVARSRQRHLREGDTKAREIGERGRPGDHQIASGARLDHFDRPVAHEIDRRRDQQKGHGCGQQTAETQRRVARYCRPRRSTTAGRSARHARRQRTTIRTDRPAQPRACRHRSI